MTYIFEADHFSISDTAIHLLRSRFNYKSYSFDDIDKIIVKKGRLVNNWIIVLFFGVFLIGFSCFYSFRFYQMFVNGEIGRFYVEELVVPVIPFFLGLYSVYFSLRIGPVLKIVLKNKRVKCLPLD